MRPFNRCAALKWGMALAGIFALTPGAWARGNPIGAKGVNWSNEYFVAAKPVGVDALNSYPASLFMVTSDHKLHLVRQFFSAGQHFSDFANDLHGTVYLAGPGGIYVVHAGDPKQAVFVPVHQFDDTFCWGAVYGGGTQAGVQYCPSRKVNLIAARPNKNGAREEPGSWAAFKDLQFRGEQGGPFLKKPPTAEIDGTELVMPYGAKPKVVLAELPPADGASPNLRRRVSILASTPRYLVIWIQPATFSGSVGASGHRLTAGAVTFPPHQAPVAVLVLDKRNHRWQTLELPTAVSTKTDLPVRVFGDWMVTTEMAWSPPTRGTGTAGLGIANEQKTPMYSAPSDVHAAYDRRFQNIQIPGKLAIWNLADGRKITLDTGQEDSEVLAIGKAGKMLYRVNDAIYSASIEGNKIAKTALVVKAPAVTNVHWAFASGGEHGRETGE